ncbi:sensor histidine kinase [Nonomuraea sp. NN258]|uniref:sensor histidine kinase n=1 Tax=Nonomuraea antri TaxID=2730852 RepID=UPI001569CB7D|nr:sensor histidine kinase [Nonomuraea antri]NRQ34566.1 sensor histidine kinase [Nonomuraea antri]
MRSPHRLTAIDWLVTAVVSLFVIAEEVTQRSLALSRESFSPWAAAAVVVAVAIGVLLRRRFPFAILMACSAVNSASLALTGGPATAWQFYTQLLLLFTLLSELPPRSAKAVTGLAATLGYVVVMATLGSSSPGWGDVAVALVMTSLAAGSGLAVHRHRELAVLAAERGRLLAREAVAAERGRIARELHDIIAHSVSVMTMHSSGVRLRLRDDHESERQMLVTVEETGREALIELRRMVGLLRTSQDDPAPPGVGLDRLPDLLDQIRSAGLEVTLDVRGEPAPLPAALDLSAYRIVQESLTNALKHAGPTRAAVTVAYRPGELRLEIIDHGPAERRARPSRTSEAGHGLIGMRERAALFGGTLTAEPDHSGGFRVQAVLPR